MRGEELDSTCRDKRRVAMILIVEAHSASGIIDDIIDIAHIIVVCRDF